jgi:hypothetical protein
MMTDHRQDEPSGSTESTETPAESHVDRAMLGPTPDNPSLSLKKRLKRAAFFDKRDREVAAGEAAPVDADAGLPDQMVEDIAELEDHAADRS